MYVIIEEPISRNFGRAIDDERLTNRHESVSENDKNVRFIDERIESSSAHEEASPNEETDSETFSINDVISWKIHDRIDQKRDDDWRINVYIRHIVNFSNFSCDGDDRIIDKSINNKHHAHECHDDPPVRILEELVIGHSLGIELLLSR